MDRGEGGRGKGRATSIILWAGFQVAPLYDDVRS